MLLDSCRTLVIDHTYCHTHQEDDSEEEEDESEEEEEEEEETKPPPRKQQQVWPSFLPFQICFNG